MCNLINLRATISIRYPIDVNGCVCFFLPPCCSLLFYLFCIVYFFSSRTPESLFLFYCYSFPPTHKPHTRDRQDRFWPRDLFILSRRRRRCCFYLVRLLVYTSHPSLWVFALNRSTGWCRLKSLIDGDASLDCSLSHLIQVLLLLLLYTPVLSSSTLVGTRWNLFSLL